MKGNLYWKIGRNKHKTTQRRAQQETAGFEQSVVPSSSWWLSCSLLFLHIHIFYLCMRFCTCIFQLWWLAVMCWRPNLEPGKTFSPAPKLLSQMVRGFPAAAGTCQGSGLISWFLMGLTQWNSSLLKLVFSPGRLNNGKTQSLQIFHAGVCEGCVPGYLVLVTFSFHLQLSITSAHKWAAD